MSSWPLKIQTSIYRSFIHNEVHVALLKFFKKKGIISVFVPYLFCFFSKFRPAFSNNSVNYPKIAISGLEGWYGCALARLGVPLPCPQITVLFIPTNNKLVCQRFNGSYIIVQILTYYSESKR